MTQATLSAKLRIIQPSGHINASNAVEFKSQLTEAVVAGEDSALLVDMHQLESLDSAGLMALVHGLKLARHLERPFGLCSVAPSIRIMLELTKLDGVFDIFDSHDAFATAL